MWNKKLRLSRLITTAIFLLFTPSLTRATPEQRWVSNNTNDPKYAGNDSTGTGSRLMCAEPCLFRAENGDTRWQG